MQKTNSTIYEFIPVTEMELTHGGNIIGTTKLVANHVGYNSRFGDDCSVITNDKLLSNTSAIMECQHQESL